MKTLICILFLSLWACAGSAQKVSLVRGSTSIYYSLERVYTSSGRSGNDSGLSQITMGPVKGSLLGNQKGDSNADLLRQNTGEYIEYNGGSYEIFILMVNCNGSSKDGNGNPLVVGWSKPGGRDVMLEKWIDGKYQKFFQTGNGYIRTITNHDWYFSWDDSAQKVVISPNPNGGIKLRNN